MANQMVSTGRAVTSGTTGSAVNLIPRGCQLLGFWANASGALSIYDSATAAGAGASSLQGVAISACAVGWNPMPLDLVNGLTVNQAAQLTFVIQ